MDLKRAIITPIYIQGWLRDSSQEQPSCSPYITLYKNTEKILAKNIHQFLETHPKMYPKQHGFRSGRSCLSQQLEHHNKILEELEKSNVIYLDVIYYDFAKAFDKVDHGILLKKLKKLGINCKIGLWIHNFLSNRQQCVVLNGTTSSEAQVKSVVP